MVLNLQKKKIFCKSTTSDIRQTAILCNGIYAFEHTETIYYYTSVWHYFFFFTFFFYLFSSLEDYDRIKIVSQSGINIILFIDVDSLVYIS